MLLLWLSCKACSTWFKIYGTLLSHPLSACLGVSLVCAEGMFHAKSFIYLNSVRQSWSIFTHTAVKSLVPSCLSLPFPFAVGAGAPTDAFQAMCEVMLQVLNGQW